MSEPETSDIAVKEEEVQVPPNLEESAETGEAAPVLEESAETEEAVIPDAEADAAAAVAASYQATLDQNAANAALPPLWRPLPLVF